MSTGGLNQRDVSPCILSHVSTLLTDIMVPSFQTDGVDLNGSLASLPTAAATITTVCSSMAANGNGSRASSRVSLPGLDWDEQVHMYANLN